MSRDQDATAGWVPGVRVGGRGAGAPLVKSASPRIASAKSAPMADAGEGVRKIAVFYTPEFSGL
jgi:hypothetical protein